MYRPVEPNGAHSALGRSPDAIVTQNIDGPHQRAGPRAVWELHGTKWSRARAAGPSRRSVMLSRLI